MKTVIAIFALFAVAFVVSNSDMFSVVHKEVRAIFNRNPNITQADCQQQCDDIFDMLVKGDEKQTDRYCKNRCHCFATMDYCSFHHHKQGQKHGHKHGHGKHHNHTRHHNQ